MNETTQFFRLGRFVCRASSLLFGLCLTLPTSAAIQITEFQIEEGMVRIVFDDPEQTLNHFTLWESTELGANSWTELPDASLTQIDSRRFLFVVPMINADRRFFAVAGAFLSSELDPDGDGLPTALENVLGTNPSLADTDGDGFSDGVEYNLGSDPNNPLSFPDLTTQPRAQFAEATSAGTEGSPPFAVRIIFDRPYYGSLKFRVLSESTAVAGVDYVTLASEIAVAGTEVQLPITWIDDDQISPIRLLFLELVTDPALPYARGGQPVHTVMLNENDAWWSGVMSSGFEDRNFRLKRVHSNGTVSATFAAGAGQDGLPLLEGESEGARSDQSVGVIPVGSFPATVEADSTAHFKITSPAMPAPTGGLLGPGTGLTRTLVLEALPILSDPSNGHEITPVRVVGSFSESLSHPDGTVCAQRTGTMVLVQQVPERPRVAR